MHAPCPQRLVSDPAAAHASLQARGTDVLGVMKVHAVFLVSPHVRFLSWDMSPGVPSLSLGPRPEAPLGRGSFGLPL